MLLASSQPPETILMRIQESAACLVGEDQPGSPELLRSDAETRVEALLPPCLKLCLCSRENELLFPRNCAILEHCHTARVAPWGLLSREETANPEHQHGLPVHLPLVLALHSVSPEFPLQVLSSLSLSWASCPCPGLPPAGAETPAVPELSSGLDAPIVPEPPASPEHLVVLISTCWSSAPPCWSRAFCWS